MEMTNAQKRVCLRSLMFQLHWNIQMEYINMAQATWNSILIFCKAHQEDAWFTATHYFYYVGGMKVKYSRMSIFIFNEHRKLLFEFYRDPRGLEYEFKRHTL